MRFRSGKSVPSPKRTDNNSKLEVSCSDKDDGNVASSDSDYLGFSNERGEDALVLNEDNASMQHADLSDNWELDSDFCEEDIAGDDLGFGMKEQSKVKDTCTNKRRRGTRTNTSRRRGMHANKTRRRGCRREEEVVFHNSDEKEQKAHEFDTDAMVEGTLQEVKKTRKKKRKKNRPTLMWEIWEEENDKWAEENMETDIDLDYQNGMAFEMVEPPSDLIMPLLRYQKEWLAWALKQEESAAGGGILADEMGMGKTIQAIALVLAKQQLLRDVGYPVEQASSSYSSLELPKVKGTLVICPVVAVIQWVDEIERFTCKGSNKVLVYHGAKRAKNVSQFSEYDFVITTYSIVESEYRKNVMPPKQKCIWCGKLFYECKLSIHLKYFCGPQATRTAKQSKQQRKKSMMYQAKKSATGKSSEAEDKNRKGPCTETLEPGFMNKEPGIDSPVNNMEVKDCLSERKSILHSLKWDRIILDEAHYIKDRSCNTTRAVLALQSTYKWALSGTPLQNRVGELYSLVRFLQMVPYSYYFCKDCDCRALDYSSPNCPYCPHKSVRHFCWWNKYVASPIQNYGNSGKGLKAMILLRRKLLKSMVLRRTKNGRAADLALPPRIVMLRKDTLDIKEEDYYESLYNESQAKFNTYIQAGTVMNNYAHIFDLLTRLRQAVDHPYLVVYSSTALERRDMEGVINGEQLCCLCHEQVDDSVISSCGHLFCKSCLIDYSASMGQIFCPSCSKPLNADFTSNGSQSTKITIKGFKASSILNRVCLENFQSSTKIDALREEIRFMIERDGSAKGIVFSQFTSFLDLIHYSLQKSGINCVQLIGSMSIGARDAAISKFKEDPDCRIFLMSLKAGGVALNLTAASHVFLMDPWWNPAVERQAQDRIHRIGQYKPIRIVRFVIQNTVEERILKLQEKKELVFEGTVGGSVDAIGKLTEEDLRFLFVT